MEKLIATGVKWFDGDIDGKKISSGTVFVDERLDDRRGTAKGRAATPYKLENAAVAQALSRYDFPLECNVQFDRVTNGKGESETIITEIRPALDHSSTVTTKKAA